METEEQMEQSFFHGDANLTFTSKVMDCRANHRLFFSRIFQATLNNYDSTLKCRYNAVRFIAILPTALQLQQLSQLTDELLGVCCEKFGENWPRFNGTALHLQKSMMTSSNGNIFRVTGPLCGEFTGPGEFPAQRPVTRSYNVFFHQRLNKRLSKQPWGWWFETPGWSLWRHRNAHTVLFCLFYLYQQFQYNEVTCASKRLESTETQLFVECWKSCSG